MPLTRIVREFIERGVANPKNLPLKWLPDADMAQDSQPKATLKHDCVTPDKRVSMVGVGVTFDDDPKVSFQPVLVGHCKRCRVVYLAAVYDFDEWDDFKDEIARRTSDDRMRGR